MKRNILFYSFFETNNFLYKIQSNGQKFFSQVTIYLLIQLQQQQPQQPRQRLLQQELESRPRKAKAEVLAKIQPLMLQQRERKQTVGRLVIKRKRQQVKHPQLFSILKTKIMQSLCLMMKKDNLVQTSINYQVFHLLFIFFFHQVNHLLLELSIHQF